MSAVYRHRRESLAVIDEATNDLTPAAGYKVTAYEAGAQVASGSSGTTATVRAGHGFAAGDKALRVNSSDGSIDEADYREVASVTATTVVFKQSMTVYSGDDLVNLGPDNGTPTPLYDSSGHTIYSDMDGSTAIGDETVTADSKGEYQYWVETSPVWELIRDGNSDPVMLIKDALPPETDTAEYRADDYATIQAAIDAAAAAGGGTVKLTPGDEYTENITMKTEVTLDGGFATLKPASDAATIAFDQTTNCVRATLRDLIVDGADTKSSFTSNDGVLIQPAAGFFHDTIRLDNVRISDAGRCGLSVIGESVSQFVQHLSCRAVRVVDCGQQGLNVAGWVLESYFESCAWSRNYTTDTTEESILLDSNPTASDVPKRMKFVSCFINNISQTSGPLVHAGAFVDVNFDSCLFENAAATGPDDLLLCDGANNTSLSLNNCRFSASNNPTCVNLQRLDGFKASGCRFDAGTGAAFEFSATGVDQLDNIDIWDRSNVVESTMTFLTEGSNPEAKVFRAFGTIDDATPPVGGWKYWKTPANTGITVTALDEGVIGQEVFILFTEANTTFDFSGTTLKGNAAVDKNFAADDMVRCVFDGTNWHCELMLAA